MLPSTYGNFSYFKLYICIFFQPEDRGPLSPTLTGKLPGINVAPQESLLLGYMSNRDDFEDFDKSVEGLVSQIGVKSLEDEDIDTALQLVHVDMYERLLREVELI